MLIERLRQARTRFSELEAALARPEAVKDQRRYQELAKELAQLRLLVERFGRYEQVVRELDETQALLKNESKEEGFRALYEEEWVRLSAERSALERELEDLLLKDSSPDSDRNIIIEIRAGTGGEEAALFARDLFRMYSRYGAAHGLKLEVMNTNVSGKGGFKEVIFGISGRGVFEKFQFEIGTHRVQRVPETEASGRIHTSASTVAVLPEPTEVEIEIRPEDLRIDICRSGGPGGQGVNTTDSAVQILHIPTGLIVRCQDERSQHKNKAKAMRVLRARLLEAKREKQMRELSEKRRQQVGSGDRSEKIRTYNFPDRRVTDHRIGLTLHTLPQIMEGELDELFDALRKEDRIRRLKAG